MKLAQVMSNDGIYVMEPFITMVKLSSKKKIKTITVADRGGP
jgi:hypothetical protein